MFIPLVVASPGRNHVADKHGEGGLGLGDGGGDLAPLFGAGAAIAEGDKGEGLAGGQGSGGILGCRYGVFPLGCKAGVKRIGIGRCGLEAFDLKGVQQGGCGRILPSIAVKNHFGRQGHAAGNGEKRFSGMTQNRPGLKGQR